MAYHLTNLAYDSISQNVGISGISALSLNNLRNQFITCHSDGTANGWDTLDVHSIVTPATDTETFCTTIPLKGLMNNVPHLYKVQFIKSNQDDFLQIGVTHDGTIFGNTPSGYDSVDLSTRLHGMPVAFDMNRTTGNDYLIIDVEGYAAWYHSTNQYQINVCGPSGDAVTLWEATTAPSAACLSIDGAKLFVVDSATSIVHQFDLATPFSFAGGILYSGKTYDASGVVGTVTGIVQHNNKLIMSSSTTIYQFTLEEEPPNAPINSASTFPAIIVTGNIADPTPPINAEITLLNLEVAGYAKLGHDLVTGDIEFPAFHLNGVVENLTTAGEELPLLQVTGVIALGSPVYGEIYFPSLGLAGKVASGAISEIIGQLPRMGVSAHAVAARGVETVVQFPALAIAGDMSTAGQIVSMSSLSVMDVKSFVTTETAEEILRFTK